MDFTKVIYAVFLHFLGLYPYLELQISEDMKWSTHINSTAKKASSTLGFLRKNLKYSPKKCKKTTYITLVKSIILPVPGPQPL
jgi:hypothetical protein